MFNVFIVQQDNYSLGNRINEKFYLICLVFLPYVFSNHKKSSDDSTKKMKFNSFKDKKKIVV